MGDPDEIFPPVLGAAPPAACNVDGTMPNKIKKMEKARSIGFGAATRIPSVPSLRAAQNIA